jgi:hypothetical protein
LPKKDTQRGQAKMCGMSGSEQMIARQDCIFERLQHCGFPFGRVFLRSACFCEFQKKPICSIIALRRSVNQGRPCHSDAVNRDGGFRLPDKARAARANAMTAPLAAAIEVVQTLGGQTWVQLKRSLVQIWTLILTNYDMNLELN